MAEQIPGDQTLLSPCMNDLPSYSVYTAKDPNMGLWLKHL